MPIEPEIHFSMLQAVKGTGNLYAEGSVVWSMLAYTELNTSSQPTNQSGPGLGVRVTPPSVLAKPAPVYSAPRRRLRPKLKMMYGMPRRMNLSLRNLGREGGAGAGRG
jgi:hypothetical protein